MRCKFVLLTGSLLFSTASCDSCGKSQPILINRDAARTPPAAQVIELTATSAFEDALGRRGDLALVSSSGARLVFATNEEPPHTRPIRGAVVDIGFTQDQADPLLWWRVGITDGEQHFTPMVASRVARMTCDNGSAGVRITGELAQREGSLRLETHACVGNTGHFTVESRITRGTLPPGSKLTDELNTGTTELFVAERGSQWDESALTRWVAFAAHNVGAVFAFAQNQTIQRKVIRVGPEIIRTESTVQWEGTSVTRTLNVVRGDVLDAVATLAPGANSATVRFQDPRGGTLLFRDAQNNVIGEVLSVHRERRLQLPPDFARSVDLRNGVGLTVSTNNPLDGRTLTVSNTPMGVIRVRYSDAAHAPLPVHVILQGTNGTPNPTPRSTPRRYAAENTLYLLDGWAEIPVRPGTYQVIATHGPAHSLSVRDVTVTDGAVASVEDSLTPAMDLSQYTSADFHLHSAPSFDSRVTLAERVASLVCEGISLAVATDHNAITDLAPTVAALGLQQQLSTIAGDEITTTKPLLGHFNAFPVLSRGLGHEAALPYHDLTAEQIFAGARSAGVSVLQVNHARMSPGLGYFDLTSFSAATGEASTGFSQLFDALEVFNGMYIEQPNRVREALQDVVGLARRGVRVAATGNSDSHHLVIEEAGWPRTYVRVPAEPLNTRTTRVMEAVRRGQTVVSSGPLVELTVQGAGPGDFAFPRNGRVSVQIRVSAASWIPVDHVELWQDDQVIFQAPITTPARDGVRFEYNTSLPVTRDAVLIAWASAETPIPHVLPHYPNARALGFTSPVYVDLNGDRSVRSAARTAEAGAGAGH